MVTIWHSRLTWFYCVIFDKKYSQKQSFGACLGFTFFAAFVRAVIPPAGIIIAIDGRMLT